MKIDKVMNNNVVSSIDEDGQEIIVVGTGIGFQGKEGKVVDEKKIQKIFRSVSYTHLDVYKRQITNMAGCIKQIFKRD